MKKYLFATAIALTCNGHAHADQMTVDFVGDWCYDQQQGKEIRYQLPSWGYSDCSKDKILSIAKDHFYREGVYCTPVRVKVKKDGVAYTARVTANCSKVDSSMRAITAEKIQHFEIARYKGNLGVLPLD